MPRKVRKPPKAPQIRRVLTRAERATAAARNVALFDRHELAQLVAAFILDTGQGSKSLPAPIRAAVELRNAAVRHPLSSLHFGTLPGDYKAIREQLLAIISTEASSVFAKDDALFWITSDWLGDRLDAHAEALDELRETHPRIFRALFERQLRLAARLGTQAGIDRSRLKHLLCDHARILLIGMAHDNIAHIRRLAISPHGRHFAGYTVWKSAGHVLLTSVAEPAIAVSELIARAPTMSGDDDAVRKKLLGDKLLASGAAGDFVWAVAIEVCAMLRRAACADARVTTKLGAIANAVAAVAGITNRDIFEQNLTQTSMSGFWFGLESSEAATFVAIDLIKALNAVEALVEAVLDQRALEAHATKPPRTKTIFVATVLRAAGQPDREAAQLGTARGGDGGLDPANKGSRGPLASLQVKLRDPVIAERASRTFGIDPVALFRR